jgi:pimeloyl-ACP methyl ester carboxylesterase
MMFSLLASVEYRPLLPAVINRLLRCNDADVRALNFGGAFSRSLDLDVDVDNQTGFSTMLQINVAMAELIEIPPPLSINETRDAVDSYYVASTGTLFFREAYDAYAGNLYERDGFWGQYADRTQPSSPLLLLNGLLDPQTPHWWAEHEAQAFDTPGSGVTYVEIPYAPHGVIYTSPTTDDKICGLEMIARFFESNGTTVATSCLDRLLDIDFKGERELTKAVAELVCSIACRPRDP